jgi:hypothetical protein
VFLRSSSQLQTLALQLQLNATSESMRDHDREVVDDRSIDSDDASAVAVVA